jgi:hypothetical protein
VKVLILETSGKTSWTGDHKASRETGKQKTEETRMSASNGIQTNDPGVLSTHLRPRDIFTDRLSIQSYRLQLQNCRIRYEGESVNRSQMDMKHET